MKKILFALALALSTSFAAAQTEIKLTPEQVKQLTSQEQPSNLSEKARKELSAWGELGQGMGVALVSAAKEVGVAANDFASTPLGKITVALVVYKMIGRDLTKFLVGTMILVVGWSFGLNLSLKNRRTGPAQYEYRPFLFGAWNRKVVVEEKFMSAGDREGYVIAGIIVLAASTIIGLIVIF